MTRIFQKERLTSEEQETFETGAKAFRNKEPIEANPFSEKSVIKHFYWNLGWIQEKFKNK